MRALHPGKIKNLITMVTPVTSTRPKTCWRTGSAKIDVDLMVDTLGNVSGELELDVPQHEALPACGQKYIDMVDILDDKEKPPQLHAHGKSGSSTSPDQAGETYRQFINDLLQGEQAVAGGLMLGRREVNLGDIKVPVLETSSRRTTTSSPPVSSKALKKHTSGRKDYTGAVVQGRAYRHLRQQLPPSAKFRRASANGLNARVTAFRHFVPKNPVACVGRCPAGY